MKNTFVRLLVVLTCVMLLLTGCNSQEKDYATKIVEFNDGTYITKGDMVNVYKDTYSYYYYLYYMNYGYVPEQLPDYVKQQTVNAYVAQEVIKKHAADYGIELTAEMQAEAEAAATAEWDQYIANYVAQYSTEEQPLTNEDAIAAVTELGYTYEYMLKEHTDSVLVSAITEKMTENVAEPTEEEIVALYNANVAEDEETYTADSTAYENALTAGTPIYWAPEFYRGVQHILLRPTDEGLLTQYTEAAALTSNLQTELLNVVSNGVTEEGRTSDVITAELNAASAAQKEVEAAIIANCQPSIDLINQDLANGIAFPDLIFNYTVDSDSIFYVGPNTASLITPFKNGAMSLEKVGDISEPIVGEYGVHIIYYAEDVASGAVEMESVREALAAEAYQNAKDAVYQEMVDKWTEEAGAKINLDRWSDNY